MKINKDTALIKAHYFMFFAGMVPILPFFIVLGVGLGVPIALQGALGAIIMLATVFAKPLLSLVADAFPNWRKTMFVTLVFACGLSLGSICFVSAFGVKPFFDSVYVLPKDDFQNDLFTTANDSSMNYFDKIRNSLANESSLSFDEDINLDDILMLLPSNESCTLLHGHDCTLPTNTSSPSYLQLTALHTEGVADVNKRGLYSVTSSQLQHLHFTQHSSMTCTAGAWYGDCDGRRVWQVPRFWLFVFLLLIGTVTFSTANSFTDTITVETVGPSGNYGSQRAWGSAGWGLFGPVSGLLVDWWSGFSEVKDYTPAFMLVFIFMGVDVIIASKLKVPKFEEKNQVWASVWPLLKQPRFFLFLFFSILNGCFDAVVLNFLFVLQEDMAAGTDSMQNIKFIQGMTIFVQCATEVPCMFFSDRLVKRLGADRVTTVVLALHSVRLLLIFLTGTYGTVWLTVAVELLNGPCYGFGYSAIVVYAGQMAPPGVATTVQSLANVSYECIGYALSTLLSGVMIASFRSVKTFLLWSGVAALTTILHVFYVTCVPPIKDTFLNQALSDKAARDEACPGTVEEELCLEGSDHRPVNDDNTLAEVSDCSSDYAEDDVINKSWDKYLARSITDINDGAVSNGTCRHLPDDSFDTIA